MHRFQAAEMSALLRQPGGFESGDRRLVGSYYEARLPELLERVRDGFARYDAGELDAFDGLDICGQPIRITGSVEVLRHAVRHRDR